MTATWRAARSPTVPGLRDACHDALRFVAGARPRAGPSRARDRRQPAGRRPGPIRRAGKKRRGDARARGVPPATGGPHAA